VLVSDVVEQHEYQKSCEELRLILETCRGHEFEDKKTSQHIVLLVQQT